MQARVRNATGASKIAVSYDLNSLLQITIESNNDV